MNCKPGDLAIVVYSTAGNDGRLVEVIRPLGVNPRFHGYTWDAPPGYRWLVRSLGTPLVARFPDGSRSCFFEMPFADAWLRPLRPDPEPEPESTDTPKELEHS